MRGPDFDFVVALSPSEDIRHQTQASATYPISQTLLFSFNLPIKCVMPNGELELRNERGYGGIPRVCLPGVSVTAL